MEVVAAVATREGRWLVCQRPLHKHHGGLWEFPGGKVEPGEDLAQALIRELREELAVDVTHVGEPLFKHHESARNFTLHFLPASWEGEPTALEHSALKWCTPQELELLELAPADALFVQFLLGKASTHAGGGKRADP